MIAVVLSQIRVHWTRLIAIGLGIALASGFVASTLIINSSLRASLKEAVGESYSRSDVVVVPPLDSSVSGEEISDIVRTLEAVDGVTSVSINARAVTGGKGRDFPESMFTVTPAPTDSELDTFQISSGSRPDAITDLVLDESTAEELGIDVGAELELTVASVPIDTDGGSMPIYRGPGESNIRFTVVGIVDKSKDPNLAGVSHAIVTSASYQEYFAHMGEVDAIRFAIDESTAEHDVITALNRAIDDSALHADLSAVTVDEAMDRQVEKFSDGNDVVTWILLGFAGISVTVAILVVSNTFSLIIAGRRKELALLRCLGATRKQLYGSVLVEGLVIGLLGSIVGVLASTAFSLILGEAVRYFWADEFGYLTIETPVSALSIGVAVGVVFTVCATLAPARSAISVPPLEALQPLDETDSRSPQGRVRTGLGLACFVLGSGLIALALFLVHDSGAWILAGALGGALIVLGLVLCSVLIIPPVAGAIGELLIRPWGIAGHMATLNTMRNRRRTAATATALIIGVTLVSTILVGGVSAKETAAFGLEQRYPVDLSVTLDSTVDQETVEELRAVPGVTAVTVANRAEVADTYEGSVPEVFVLDPESAEAVLQEAAPRLVPGRVIVPSDFERDSIELRGLTTKTLPVEKSGGSSRAFFITPDTGNELGVSATSTVVLAKLEEGADVDQIFRIRTEAAAILDVSAPEVTGSAIDRGMYSQIIDILLLIAVGLLFVAILIALIGVSNTMSLSVIERERENALMRALGLSIAQLRALLAFEAVLISAVAALIGIALGTGLGIAGTRLVTSPFSETLVIDWPVLPVLGILVVAIVAGILSSLAPARRAAKLSPVEGLGKEN